MRKRRVVPAVLELGRHLSNRVRLSCYRGINLKDADGASALSASYWVGQLGQPGIRVFGQQHRRCSCGERIESSRPKNIQDLSYQAERKN